MRPTPTPSPSVNDPPVTSRSTTAAVGTGPSRIPSIVLILTVAAALSVVFSTRAPAQETFGKTPTTPIELWDAADYLMRTGQPEQAVPYLNKFLKSNPDDATLMGIRDKYGVGTILRLQDNPATRSLAEPLASKLAAASRRNSTQPDRINRFIGDLTKTREEQEYALDRLREAGPFAVPAMLNAADNPALSDEDHALLVSNMGRLDLSAVPPLIAALDAPKPRLAADAAKAIGLIGDPRAVVALTALAASLDPNAPEIARSAAQRAIARITGRPYVAQPTSPIRLLTIEAQRYHRHAIKFPGDPVVVWLWDPSAQTPVPKTVSRTEAEGYFGLKFARAALAIDPTDRPAQVVIASIALEKAAERAGLDRFPADDPSGTFAAAIAAGPGLLGDVLRAAIADHKYDLAAVAATALGKVTDANGLAVRGTSNPLVEALSSPDRRTRFAAARALVLLDPRVSFAGSSRVVPVLAQFVTAQTRPRALVIDGNTTRGSQLTGQLAALGYDPVLAATGDEGFRVAAESADIELILIDNHMIAGDWRVHDTLANLKADARTAAIPTYIVGPLGREVDLNALLTERFPGVRFIVTPPDAQSLGQQITIAGKPVGLSDRERVAYARYAAVLLAQVATRPNSPFEPDLARVEPALSIALQSPETNYFAIRALGDVPDQNAQRALAALAIDPGTPVRLRVSTVEQLARSIQRFGPLVTAAQERQLLTAFDGEADPTLRTSFASVIGALRPQAETIGLRLRRLGPGPSVAEPNLPPAAPAPSEPAPAPATEAVPAPEAKP